MNRRGQICIVRLTTWLLALATFLAILAPSVSAQQLAKRLILKDGTYQLATRWEIKGDRVRYLSAERNEWEEVPESLVDWKATSKFEQDRAAGARNADAVEIDKEAAAERAAEEAKTPQVAPELRLPDNGSMLLLDSFQNQPQLVELQQNGGAINRNRAQNMIRAAVIPIPITSSKQTIEIEGAHAVVQAHATLPSIYVNLEERQGPSGSNSVSQSPQQPQQPQQPQMPEQSWDRFHIVVAQSKKNKRIVGVVKINPLGKVSQQENLVATTCQQLTGGWVKVTPTAPLAPGEYAVVELLGRQGMNMYVWDFGVNPSAPANGGALKPEVPTPATSNAPQGAQPQPH
ncbi:MAG TPA: hypothetical protein VKR60_08230 [Candidatus Sulfotelmatobacter sp.]|nr:hypothetical protein [Candidatus Sulfotelmatobacter sp.]